MQRQKAYIRPENMTKTSLAQTVTLPAAAIAQQVNESLQTHPNLVITAPPGAGKSTLLPLTIHEAFGSEGKILMLEPRRLAARQIAERMAEMIGEAVGQTVGYRVRHDTRISSHTRIEVITEGILTRMLIEDPTLDGVAVVIFDEFHERSIHSDVALALTREAQQVIRPDLRIVIMSATIDAHSICQALNAPLVESEGRMYPITDIRPVVAEVDYSAPTLASTSPRELLARQVAHCIRQAHHDHEGDILAFLPGEAEIRLCQDMLAESLSPTRVLPLYGMLPHAEQRLAIAPSRPGERKVVLATSIAETSLTIQGVRIVIDSGLCRQPVYDPTSGLSHLQTVRISLDMANQRRGRAGRVAPGVCYRLWSLGTEHRMAECRRPEILDADLTPMLLDVTAWGEADPLRLPWLTIPPAGSIAQARQLLQLLQAIDDKGQLTAHGQKLAQQPYHPRIANMLLSPFVTQAGGKGRELARQLAEYLEGSLPAAERRRIESQLLDTPTTLIPEVAPLIAAAYPERIAQALPEGCGHFRLASGDNAMIDANDSLAARNWLAIASLHAQPGGIGRIFLAAPVVDIGELSSFCTVRDNITWDNKRGQLVSQREQRIGRLLVSTKPISNISIEQQQQIICQAVQIYGTSMLDFNDDVQNLQRRVAAVASWHPELDLPDLSTEAVVSRASDWLTFYLGKARTTAELRRIDLRPALWSLLTYDQQIAVDRLAPSHIAVPTGSRIHVEYRQGAELPILRVRLQECFGLTDTPRVDDGQRPVLMELLSPGFKPVQLTSDLRSFWSGTYFEVRKELRRRYPKHAWPDDPLQAEAVRGVRKRIDKG